MPTQTPKRESKLQTEEKRREEKRREAIDRKCTHNLRRTANVKEEEKGEGLRDSNN
jgi:hypothetical protein